MKNQDKDASITVAKTSFKKCIMKEYIICVQQQIQ